MVAMMVLFFWFLAAILLLAGIVLFGQNLIIGAAFGGAAIACVLIMDIIPAACFAPGRFSATGDGKMVLSHRAALKILSRIRRMVTQRSRIKLMLEARVITPWHNPRRDKHCPLRSELR
jgi:hypothetical protein